MWLCIEQDDYYLDISACQKVIDFNVSIFYHEPLIYIFRNTKYPLKWFRFQKIINLYFSSITTTINFYIHSQEHVP